MPDPPDEPFLEGLRFLRAAIQTLPDGSAPRLLLVCPAGEAPSAEDVALYLAHSFAEAGKRVKFILPSPGPVMPARTGQWMDRVEIVPPGLPDTGTTPDPSEGEYVVEYSAVPAGQGTVASGQRAILVFDPAAASLGDLKSAASSFRRAGTAVAGVALCKRRRA